MWSLLYGIMKFRVCLFYMQLTSFSMKYLARIKDKTLNPFLNYVCSLGIGQVATEQYQNKLKFEAGKSEP